MNKKQNDYSDSPKHCKLWREYLERQLKLIYKKSRYRLLESKELVGLFTCIFVKDSEKTTNLSSCEIKTGFGGLHGNKGGISVRFIIEDSSFCFTNCHLAAGDSHVGNRNSDARTILYSYDHKGLPEAPEYWFKDGGDGSAILDHECCFLYGDLNYRIDLPRPQVEELILQHDWEELYRHDQLNLQFTKNVSFALRMLQEPCPNFEPTYKYDLGTDIFDTSEKRRTPAWCDRILYRGDNVKLLFFQRHEDRSSDHRPISAGFVVRVKQVDKSLLYQTKRKVEKGVKDRRRELQKSFHEILTKI